MSEIQGLDWGEFSTNDIAAVAGVSKNVIADWVARGLVSVQQSPGRGHDRVYTFWNAVEAVIAAQLNRIGIRSGTVKNIMGVFEFEANVLNTATKTRGGHNDFVLVIRMDPDGMPNSIYREMEKHRLPEWKDDEPTLLNLRIDVGIAIAHVQKVLKV